MYVCAAAKVCLIHISLAHRDWVPAGQLPSDHREAVHLVLQALMGMYCPCSSSLLTQIKLIGSSGILQLSSFASNNLH